MLDKDKHIYVCGLDGDYQMKQFGQMLEIIPLCNEVEKLTAICSICANGKKAYFTKRITNETGQKVIGNDNYLPVCRKCHKKRSSNIYKKVFKLKPFFIDIMSTSNIKKVPKKRGRKSKKEKEELLKLQQEGLLEPKVEKKPKKRGRKPKGGKIIKAKNILKSNEQVANPNIILHLKCNSKDLNNYKKGQLLNKKLNVDSFNLNNNKLDYCEINNKIKTNSIIDKNEIPNDSVSSKLIHEKIKKLKINLRHNNILYKRAACFWCTYEFDNPPIYIPKCKKNDTIEVYGCFCSPECACSYLKNEKLDDSTRWERYNLLNNLYSKIYNYEKNIKPAPNPFYTLENIMVI